VISLSQRPLPDKTQQLQKTDIHATRGIRTYNLSRRVALERATTGTGYVPQNTIHMFVFACFSPTPFLSPFLSDFNHLFSLSPLLALMAL